MITRTDVDMTDLYGLLYEIRGLLQQPEAPDPTPHNGSGVREPQMNDWISYRIGGQLVISQVMYIRQQTRYPHKMEYLTIASHTVHAEEVLEVRSPVSEEKR